MKEISDLSMYPTLFCDYLSTLIPELELWYWRIVVGILSFFFMGWLNFYGMDMVGWVQYVFAVVVLSPIIVMIFMTFPKWDFNKLSPSIVPEKVDFGLLLSNLAW